MTYHDVLASIPKPSLGNCSSFTYDFFTFHSWYKHLDRRNGNRVLFFLDPEDATIGGKSVGDLRPYNFLHASEEYKWEYQKRYGCINYAILEIGNQLNANITYRGKKVKVPEALLYRQSCILFPYSYEAAFGKRNTTDFVAWGLQEWSLTDKALIQEENLPFIQAALKEWRQLKGESERVGAKSDFLNELYQRLKMEEVEKVRKAIKAILEYC